jgi:hypothetical protein
MKISQREARRLKKRVEELEAQARRMRLHWEAPYGGVHLYDWNVSKDRWYGKLEGAVAAGKTIIVRVDDTRGLRFYAC